MGEKGRRKEQREEDLERMAVEGEKKEEKEEVKGKLDRRWEREMQEPD